MNLVSCGRGHVYDGDCYAECPYCAHTEKKTDGFMPEHPSLLEELKRGKLIGRGSTGRVYRLTDPALVLKVIECGADPVKYRNARHELGVMRRLQGLPHIVQLRKSKELEEENGQVTLYLQEDYHIPFSEYLSKHPVTVSDALQIAVGICDALIECKSAGILHLDVQPKNIYVDAPDSVCIGDFGMALEADKLETVQRLRGTVSFMAPEVWREHRCGEQSDVYSVGLILYTIFNGRMLPFRNTDGKDAANKRRMAGEPLPEVTWNGKGKDFIWQLIQDACAYRTEDRIRTFDELKDRIQKILAAITDDDAGEMVLNLSDGMAGSYGDTEAPESQEDTERVEESGNWDFGDTLEDAEKTRLYCRSCGKALSSAGGFCPYCGCRADVPDPASEGGQTALENFLWNFPGTVAAGINAGPMPQSGAPSEISHKRASQESKKSKKSGKTREAKKEKKSEKAWEPKKSWGSQETPGVQGAFVERDSEKPPEFRLDRVQFSAVVPKTFIKGDYTVLDIIMYEEAFRHIVDEAIRQADSPVQEQKSGIIKVREGANIRVCLTSPDIEIEDNEETREWQGGYQDFSFAVLLPEQYKKRQILFKVSVYVNDVIATRLVFTAKCSTWFQQKIQITREDVLSAFVSYASEDRSRVAAIVQGMKKARPDMDIFLDVEKLRSGQDWEQALHHEIEERDILYLCWSQYARKSKWVDMEWRYALAYKGEESIEPVPIDPPTECPPPEELKNKHFNDMLLYLIKQETKEDE